MKGSILSLVEGDYDNREILVDFPHHLFPSEDDKAAALTHRACSDAASYMFGITQSLLKGERIRAKTLPSISLMILGISVNIEELAMTLEHLETPRTTWHVDQKGNNDPTPYPPEILRIQLRNSERFAIDMSGAQFGWYEPVLPWDTYIHLRLGGKSNRVTAINPFGYGLHRANNIAKMPDLPWNPWPSVTSFNLSFAETANSATEEWSGREKFRTLSDILRLPEVEFVDKKEELCQAVSKSLSAAITDFKKQGKYFRS